MNHNVIHQLGRGERMKELPCIVCDKPLESVYSGEVDTGTNTPYAGTVFDSAGGYGSTVFDPMNHVERLEITVCDECLVKKSTSVYYRIEQPQGFLYEMYPFKTGR